MSAQVIPFNIWHVPSVPREVQIDHERMAKNVKVLMKYNYNAAKATAEDYFQRTGRRLYD